MGVCVMFQSLALGGMAIGYAYAQNARQKPVTATPAQPPTLPYKLPLLDTVRVNRYQCPFANQTIVQNADTKEIFRIEDNKKRYFTAEGYQWAGSPQPELADGGALDQCMEGLIIDAPSVASQRLLDLQLETELAAPQITLKSTSNLIESMNLEQNIRFRSSAAMIDKKHNLALFTKLIG